MSELMTNAAMLWEPEPRWRERRVAGIGTVECVTPVFADRPQREAMRAAGLHIEHHAVPGLYVSFIYNQAGSLIEWFRRTFASAWARRAERGDL